MKPIFQTQHAFYLILIIFSLLLLLCIGCDSSSSTIIIKDLKCEYRSNPLGIDNKTPRLSWSIQDPNRMRGQKQTAYQVLVASSEARLDKDEGDLWDTGKKESNQSLNNEYAGNQLSSGDQCFWKVRIWDASGEISDWSPTAKFNIGLYHQQDWEGSWIYKEDQKKTDHNWYRKSFALEENPVSALIYVGSFGYHELYVNGEKITDNVMNPVSSYMKKRIPYLTYDVTRYLNQGENVIAIWHAAGWARWKRIKEYKNPPFVFKAQANIRTQSDSIVLSTDETWKCKKSYSEYYGDWDILNFGGEVIDDRRKESNWNTVEYDDTDWANAIIYKVEKSQSNDSNSDPAFVIKEDIPVGEVRLSSNTSEITAELSAQMVEPQVKFEEVNPIKITKNENGTHLIDMGRNYTGFFDMKLYNGTEGDSILFEISDQVEKVMNWNQKSKYIYGASGEGRFSNRFNVAGGRWITVYGLNYTPSLTDIKGYVITNDRKIISDFECSSEQLNQIYKVNLDTYIANTLDGILMDCPHRERRGWGEVTVAAMYGDALPNFESGAYMDQYTQYMRDAQLSDGQIRAIINEQDRPFLMWKANSPITVWETYRMFGDKKMLQDNYLSMKRWMNWLFENSEYQSGGALIAGKRATRAFPGLGDWCTPRGNFWSSFNSPEAIHFNNCVYAYMLDNAVKIATILGETDDANTFADRLRVQREATHNMLYDPVTGKYGDGRQVNQAFALLAGVTPESEKKKVYDNLVDNVLYRFPYYDTGSSGQALYTRYFTEYGERMDLIYELLQDTHHPSYGYFLNQGETVWPERWSSVGVSKIHTCYTGIGGYFIKGIGGIRPDPDNPGMQHILIKPAPVGDLTYANTSYQSMYGEVTVNWKKTNGQASFHIVIPPNMTAALYLPAIDKSKVREGGGFAEDAVGINYLGVEPNDAVGNYVIYHAESGEYNFTVTALPEVEFPDPLYDITNLALLGRSSASSMFIETEKLPGFEAFKANDENRETRWLSNQTSDQYLEIAWVKPQTFEKVVIDEFDKSITAYKIQYWDGSQWIDIVTDSTCGPDKVHTFESITATKCRIYIVNATEKPSIAELEIY